MTADIPQLRTPGVIAVQLGEPLSRVLYILRTRSHLIRPIGRAGILRLYSQDAVEMVRDALRGSERLDDGANSLREVAR